MAATNQTPDYDVRGLPDPAKYDRLVELESPAVWWELNGPLGGLHTINRVSAPYFERVLGGYAGKRILDLGCGGGIFAEAAARAGASVVGIDPGERSIVAAREHAAIQGLAIDYRVHSAEGFEPVEQFDAVIAVAVLEHVSDLEATLDVCARALRRGGLLAFLTHNQTLPTRKRLSPNDLSKHLAMRGLQTAEIRGLAIDLDHGSALLTEGTAVSYLGYAIKEGV